ncbi:uncharacterized protein [Centroberyx affinis]|uniref:uncharacterized protein n=1 Tax=Centroberyx affinis TaxID=166261 RepID=UPI003A5BCA6F
MWKEFVGSCSTVWIVTDINRAASKKEPWEILDNTISLMGNGGECRSISFICTKSDAIKDSRVIPTEEGRACILKRNKQTKERVREKFNKQNNIKKHFSGDSDDFFQVFTVSSTEFQKEVFLQKDETEIPKLQECLLNFNDRQSKISNYVSEAYGILSLIHGANSSKMAFHKPLLQQRLKDELDKVRQSMEKAYRAFENCLGEGVKKSQESYAKKMRFILVPKKGKDRGFHRTLKSLVENDGIYKPKTKPEININVTLASCMRDHIDEEFKQTFPNKERCGPFKGAINTFTLGTESLVDRDKDVSLQLTFLKTEEAKLKTKLNNHIRENKKKIYSSLPNSIKDSMRPCYDEAAGYRGKDTLKNMRNAIETHLKVSQNIMFSKAKDDMLDQMKRLMDHILNKLEKDMKSSINLSLKADNAIPDVTDEYARGKKCHDKLMDKSNKETPMTCVESLKPKAAPDVKSVTHAQEHILKRPAQDTKKSIKLSRVKTDDNSASDVTEQYQRGKKYHDKQMGSHKKHPPMACVEPLKPEAASDFQSVTHAQEHILKSPEQDMKKSSELSLKMDDNSVPDVTEQYQRGKKYHDKQMGNPNKETPLTCVEPLKPKAASDFQSVTHAQSHVSSVTVLNPRILHETDDHKPSYRLDCPEAGLFQCASTGLVFEMEKKGEVFYRTVDWDSFPHTLTPAGPLFSIQCPCVRQLHLPHCETLSDDPDMLLVARVIDGKLEEVQPNRMTTTHVIVDVTTFTQHGLFRKSFSHHPVQGQVLLFHQKAANRPQRCTLNVLLLPRNVPICEVKSHQRGFNLLQSSSGTLSPRGRYGLGCDLVERAEIQPKSGTFACDYSQNYQSTFQVLLDSGAKTVRLILMDRGNNDRSVWECVVPLAAAPGFEVPQIAPTLGTTSEFVQRHRNVLIKRVSEVMPIADDLLVEEVITDETYDKIKNAPTSQTQMRELLAVVCRAGSAAMSEFYKALKQNQPRLVKDLEKPSQM